jgi:hypothetical protein
MAAIATRVIVEKVTAAIKASRALDDLIRRKESWTISGAQPTGYLLACRWWIGSTRTIFCVLLNVAVWYGIITWARV